MELKFNNKILTKTQFEELWKNNFRDTVIYIHNPFCMTQENCHYCMHKGCPKNNHTEQEVENFYFKYMPKLFDYYSNIIKSQNIKLVDFGGGTPNYLSAEKFDKFCNLLPKELSEVHKIIELHPALINKEFINVLKKYKFTTLIFCFQTFDENILKEQGRLIPDYNKAFGCIKYAKELGFNTACDLITYWTKENGWWKILEKDLEKLQQLEMDEITISVLYQNKYNMDFDGLDVYRHIKRAVEEYFPFYINPENTLNENFEVAATRIYNPFSNIREDFEIYLNSLSDMTWEHEQGYSTLGFGTYKNGDKAAYSIIGPDYLTYEKFEGFDKEPSLHLHRNWNFWDSAIDIIKDLRYYYKNKNPPVSSTLTLKNVCRSINLKEEQFAHFEQGNCDSKLQPRVSFSGKSDKELEIEKRFFKGEIDE